MKNYSDDSETEGMDEDDDSEICDKETIEEKKMYSSRTKKRKRERRKRCSNDTSVDESSDLNDSDYNENYYENSDEKNDPQSSSHNKHRDLSCEQDLASGCSSQNLQSRHTDDTTSNSNDEQDKLNTSSMEYKHQIKRPKIGYTNESNVVKRMMEKMGHKDGQGLGKGGQGRLEPVEAVKQHGRRGLGLHIPGLEASGDKWDPSEEEILVVEPIQWIKNPHVDLPTFDEMMSWLKKGPKKLVIDDETQFCDQHIVTNILHAKTIFDKLDGIELRRARTRSNPYETIRSAFFLNRAAVKMANMDKACDFMFTKPRDLQDKELLYFADVCAGPGGFSEYVLWRRKWHAKGFGFTLRNENDFKLDDFYAGPCETFHPYYGPTEDGNVFDPSNQEAFRELIMQHTNNKGVHFMMSDGGFSVEGQENIQEILSKQLYLCQCLVALMIVKKEGHFVTKLFDIFTPFSAGLVYLMYRCFSEICIFKPNTSRPANSERYLICKHKRADTESVARYFKHINEILIKNDEHNDVIELVPFEELKKENEFLRYLRKSNNYLGKKQITGLRKIAAFCEDTTLVEPMQAMIREQCLKHWDIPDKSRTMPKRMKPHEKLKSLLPDSTFLSKNPKELTKETLSIISQQREYFCIPSASKNDDENNPTFYLGLGRSEVYRYTRGNWVITADRIEMPADTLLYAEQLFEMTKQHRNQRKLCTLHIIDVLFLGAENVSEKHLTERHELAKIFCEALWKPNGSHSGYTRIRTKDLFPLDSSIAQKLRVEERIMKNNKQALAYELLHTDLDSDYSDEKPYFILNCVLFLSALAEPWSVNFSKTYQQFYVYNSFTKESKFIRDKPNSANASFIETFNNRFVWHWPKDTTLSMEDLINHIDKLRK